MICKSVIIQNQDLTKIRLQSLHFLIEMMEI